ncbi:MAG: hypothetical protein H0X28_15695 [Solirubrobacterales bacterium]|nr:hypothetical protein [Solirubrobacterales bacterium]
MSDTEAEGFSAQFERALEIVRERVLPAYAAQSDWVEQLRAGLWALLMLFDEQPELARLCVVRAPAAGPEAMARCREVMQRLAREVEREGSELARAEVRAGSGVQAVGEALGVIHARLLESESARLEPLCNGLVAMIVRPYLGTQAARRQLGRPLGPGG